MRTNKLATVRRKFGKIASLDLVLYATLIFIYVGLRILNISEIQEARTFPDSLVYADMASHSILSQDLWGGWRAPGFALIYKLLGLNPYLTSVFHSALSIVSWSLLAACVAREMRVRWVRIASFAVVLAFSLSTDIILWDWTLLSESMSLSLLALFVANWLWLVRSWEWYKAVPLVMIALFWAFTRDSNAYIVLMIAGVLIVTGIAWRTQRRYLILATIFVAFFIGHNFSSDAKPTQARWTTNLYEVTTQRILPFPKRTAYFAQHGMPDTPVVLERARTWNYTDNQVWKRDPRLQEFRDWLYTHGKSTYMQFLLSRPLRTALEPLQYHPRQALFLLDRGKPTGQAQYAPAGFSPILPPSIEQIIYPKKLVYLTDWMDEIVGFQLLGVGVLAMTLVMAILLVRGRLKNRSKPTKRRTEKSTNIRSLVSTFRSISVRAITSLKQRNATWVIPVALIMLAYPHALLVFHGEPMELGRHAVQMSVQLGVGLWMLLLFAVDIIFTEVFGRSE